VYYFYEHAIVVYEYATNILETCMWHFNQGLHYFISYTKQNKHCSCSCIGTIVLYESLNFERQKVNMLVIR
jgi:hypothetical protein